MKDRENTWVALARFNRARRARIENRPDTPEQIRERVAMRQAGELAQADCLARYPEGVTPDNFAEAIRFQEERYQFHMKSIMGGAK